MFRLTMAIIHTDTGSNLTMISQYLVRRWGGSLGICCSTSTGFLLLDLYPRHWGRVQSI